MAYLHIIPTIWLCMTCRRLSSQVGIEAYRSTWDIFLNIQNQGYSTSGNYISLPTTMSLSCYATMKCSDKSDSADFVGITFSRLTIRLKKINNQWIIMHEHHILYRLNNQGEKMMAHKINYNNSIYWYTIRCNTWCIIILYQQALYI